MTALITRISLALALLFGLAAAAGWARPVARVNDAIIQGDTLPAKLSDFGFFKDSAARKPAPHVIPYDLITPLFSDYAEKYRYAYVPAGKRAKYDGDAAFDFPVGSALIKSFGYEVGGKLHLVETRVLLRRADGWIALPYVWNDTQTEAVLKRAGTRVPVTFTDTSGDVRQISYSVPNQNQCKGCHDLAGQITPIGPKARNLNHDGQLKRWVASGLLDRAPKDAPALARWDDPKASLDGRARAYLEVNCAHCHNPQGPASNSGLFFGWKVTDPVQLGVGKYPVAAGRGSGNFELVIDPGHPERSILPYRMESIDPGIAMPELGRATAHKEGLALLGKWITALPAR